MDFIDLKRRNLHHLEVSLSEDAMGVGWAVMDTPNDRAPGPDGLLD